MILKRQSIINKILVLTLALVICATVIIKPLHTNAVAPLILPAAGAYLILGTLLVTVGIMYSTDENLQRALPVAWNSMSDSLKNAINTYATIMTTAGKYTVKANQDFWAQFLAWVGSFFAVGQTALTAIGNCWTIYNGTSYTYKDVPIGISSQKIAGNTAFQLANADIVYTLSASYGINSLITIAFPNGMSLIGSCMADATLNTAGNNIVNYHLPIVTKFTNYSSVLYKMTLPVSIAGGIVTMAHDYNFANYKIYGTGNTHIDGGTLSIVGNTIKSTVGGVATALAGTYYGINHFIYQMLIDNSSIPMVVDVPYFPAGDMCPAIPAGGTLTIPIPTTIGAIVGLTGATVLTQTIAVTLPTTVTSDENVNKFKAPNIILNKFPFCIPFDVYMAFSMLLAPPETPKFIYPFKFARMGINEQFEIDFTQFNALAVITRWFLSVIFVLGLIMVTRKLINA